MSNAELWSAPITLRGRLCRSTWRKAFSGFPSDHPKSQEAPPPDFLNRECLPGRDGRGIASARDKISWPERQSLAAMCCGKAAKINGLTLPTQYRNWYCPIAFLRFDLIEAILAQLAVKRGAGDAEGLSGAAEITFSGGVAAL